MNALANAYASLAQGFSASFGTPYHAAFAVWPGAPVTDAGGSIIAPAVNVSRSCKAQISAPTQAMRETEGFQERDVRIHVLSASLAGALDTDARIIIASGPHAGTWELLSATLDTAGIGWTCRGRAR